MNVRPVGLNSSHFAEFRTSVRPTSLANDDANIIQEHKFWLKMANIRYRSAVSKVSWDPPVSNEKVSVCHNLSSLLSVSL